MEAAVWRGAWRLAVPLIAVAGFVWALKFVFFAEPIIVGDTDVLVAGAWAANRCLTSNIRPCPGVGYFPVLQYAEAVFLYRQGYDPLGVKLVFIKLSVYAFTASLVLGALFLWLRGKRVAAAVFVLAVLSSYALWHFNATYGETLAGFLTLGFVAASQWRRSALLVAILAMASVATKEIAAPFLLVMGALPLCYAAGPWRARLRGDARFLAAVAIGVMSGVLAQGLFNQFRFGTWENPALLDPVLRVPTLSLHALNVVGLWVAPNGGLLFFAPLLTGTVVALSFVGWKEKTRWSRAVGAAPFGLLIILTLGLGRWCSPFGWWSWGPRLCLPWLAPLLLLALDMEGTRLESLLRSFTRPVTRTLALAAVVVVLGIPHVSMLPDADAFYGFFQRNLDCPAAVRLDVRDPASQGAFYDCMSLLAFPHRDFVLGRAYADSGLDRVRTPLLMYGALLLGLCFWLRSLAQRSAAKDT
jgi:hypothetical protein